jgi:4-amino-4-deoxy-L-arabinose transferase-like glycosyltransferase
MLWIIYSLVEVITFFYFTNVLSKKWVVLPDKIFRKKLFNTALIIRIVWVVFSYFFFIYMNGNPFEFSAADSYSYHYHALRINDLIVEKHFNPLEMFLSTNVEFADIGYQFYLVIIYFIFGKNIFIARLLKALISAFTVILIFKLAKRNFGENVGRIAGILAMLLPNLVYYTGLHLKETEMVFLIVAFIERADNLIRSKKIKIKNLLIVVFLGMSLFTFRNVLGIAAWFGFFTAIFFSSPRVMKKGRKLILGSWFILFATLVFSDAVVNEINEKFENRTTNQANSMQWRAEREGGNSLAKYGSEAIFAPLMLLAPFPTLVNIEYQKPQMMLSGAYFTKNIYAFFVIIGIISLIKTKNYKKHYLILVFTLTYLAILALSAFALSERFHMPAVPFLIIFASLGINKIKAKHKNYYLVYLVLIVVFIVGWNWFKLAGRGMV